MKTPYKASTNQECKHYVDGPVLYGGHSYYSDDETLESKEAAEQGARFMNAAYAYGYTMAQHDIRKALGI